MAAATLPIFLPALLGLCLAYPLLARGFQLQGTPRKAAWILTTIASALMTAASLPFVADYFWGGVARVQPRPVLACVVNRFFQAYLCSDLAVGALAYRAQIGLLTGWVHHALYLCITEVAIRAGWAHIFCLCAVMELPTFLLGLSTLAPRLRSNTLFAATFFATRIVLHLILICAYAVPAGRPASLLSAVSGAGVVPAAGSVVPALLLTLVFPLHAMWFAGCVKGFIRR
ncbi:hypothetical protein C8R44DRAFT_721133, partial [Mycena epipterygia]